jgi:hypothetical protein
VFHKTGEACRFHGNDRHKQNRRGLCSIKQAKPAIFSGLMTDLENRNKRILKKFSNEQVKALSLGFPAFEKYLSKFC